MPHRYFRLKNIRQIVKWRRFQAVHQILTYSLRTYFLPSKTLNGFNGFTQIPRLVAARNEPHTLRGYVNGNTKLLGYFSCLPDPHIYESCTEFVLIKIISSYPLGGSHSTKSERGYHSEASPHSIREVDLVYRRRWIDTIYLVNDVARNLYMRRPVIWNWISTLFIIYFNCKLTNSTDN